MNTDFDKMPDSSRVWIYQADKELNEKEQSIVFDQVSSFLSGWESHGHPLTAAAKLVENQFLVLAVDESIHSASGCSIDTSVKFLKSLEQIIGAHFFERSLIPFKIGGKVTLFKLDQLKELVKNNVIKPDTVLLNTSLSDLAGFKRDWEQVAATSWISRYFK